MVEEIKYCEYQKSVPYGYAHIVGLYGTWCLTSHFNSLDVSSSMKGRSVIQFFRQEALPV